MKKALALVLALTMTLGMAGCGAQPAQTPVESGDTATGGAPSQGSATPAAPVGAMTTNGQYMGTADPNSVSINISAEPPNMNSVTTTDATAIAIMRDTLEGLVTLDSADQVIPGVAERWDVSDDKLVYTFHLRDDAVWSNGEPVTAKDFVFAWTQLFTAKTGANYAGTWAAYIKGAEKLLKEGDASELGIKAIDEQTLEVTLTEPCDYFLSLMSFPSFYPINEEFWTKVGGADGYGLDADKMLYNGAYVVSEWAHEDHITIEKNDQYWDKDNKAFIPTVNMMMFSDSNTSFNSFQAGEIDMTGLTGEQKELLTAQGVVTGQYEDGAVCYLEFNTGEGDLSSKEVGKALANDKVRRALTLAIDAETYNKSVAKSSNLAADGLVPTAVVSGKYAKARGSLLDRDLSKEDLKAMFEEGMKEAGVDVADFKPTLTTDDGDSPLKMVAFIQNQWKEKLGFEAKVEQLPFKSRLDKMSSKTFDIVVALWGPDYNDPMTYLDMMLGESGNNHTSWSNKEFDSLIFEAYKETDSDKRQQLLIDAEKILMEDMPLGPIYFRMRDYICSDKLTGVTRTAFQQCTMKYAKLAQ